MEKNSSAIALKMPKKVSKEMLGITTFLTVFESKLDSVDTMENIVTFAKIMFSELEKAYNEKNIAEITLTYQTVLSKLISYLPNLTKRKYKNILKVVSLENISFESLDINPLRESLIDICKLIISIGKLNIPVANLNKMIYIKAIDLKEIANGIDINKLKKKIEYATISNNNNIDRLKTIIKISELVPSSYYNYDIDSNLVFPEEIAYKYIRYAYSDKYSLSIEYDKSIVSLIEKRAKEIIDYMYRINEIYFEKNKEYIFEYNRESLYLSFFIGKTIQNELDFQTLSNVLFKGIYENSGVSDNRLIKMMKEFNITEPPIFAQIKRFRNYYFHKEEKANKQKTLGYFKNVLEKRYPDKESDWLKVQLQIYIDIAEMLKAIYDKLNVL